MFAWLPLGRKKAAAGYHDAKAKVGFAEPMTEPHLSTVDEVMSYYNVSYCCVRRRC